MTGFFRRFIKGYSKIAKPLNDLLEGEASKLKKEELELMPEALQAFQGPQEEMHDGTRPGICQISRNPSGWRLMPPEKD